MDKAVQIIEYIEEELLDDDVEIKPETSLFKDRVLDSMSLTTLIRFIEDEFGVRVKAMDIVYENFDTVANMISFIERKKSKQ